MDISDINKVASRKRINVEAENLRDKVSREKAKIIKLKVAQDTAYWDLKEKLNQLEGNHERLQQNMVDVQMQHETISGQYQDELRLRPETLNKLSSTREICDVLEEYSERLKDTLSRCKTDQETLCEAYRKSGQFVKDMMARQSQTDEKAQARIHGLEEKLSLTSNHQEELLRFFNAAKQQKEEEIRELKSKLNTAQRQKDELLKMTYDMTRELDATRRELDAKEKSVTSLQNDMQNLLNEFNNQCADMKNTICNLEKELNTGNEANETLKQALHNQEEFTQSICDQNRALQEKLSAAEDAVSRGTEELDQLRHELESSTTTCDTLRRDVASLIEAKEAMEKEIREKNLVLSEFGAATEAAKAEVAKIESEKVCLLENLTKAQEDMNFRTITIEQLTATVGECEAKITGLEDTLIQLRINSEEKIKVLTSSIEAKQAESHSKGETIAKLMNDIKMDMEVRNRLEVNLTNSKKELESEKERACEREKKMAARVSHLEDIVKDKEQELSKQMSIILAVRGEKEKLQEKISTMQNTIDNIQKELTGRPAPRAAPDTRDPPELDDNAVNMSPMSQPRLPPPAPVRPHKVSKLSSQKRTERRDDSPVFTLFSDSSMDGDAVDPQEVNRRFEALQRGVPISSLPLSTLKRRRPAAPAHPAPRPRAPLPDLAVTQYSPSSPILSQVRNEMHKEKAFFKTKRHSDNKPKRAKPVDYSEN